MRAYLPGLLIVAIVTGQAMAADDPSTEACRAIVAAAVPSAAYTPGLDVRGNAVPGAAYVPGVDVRGNAVAAAGPAAPNYLPDQLEIPVNPRVFDYLGGTPPRGLQDLTVNAGTLTIRRSDGQAFFNGMPLGIDPSAELVRGCRQLLVQRGAQ